jgi:hypothetical protein
VRPKSRPREALGKEQMQGEQAAFGQCGVAGGLVGCVVATLQVAWARANTTSVDSGMRGRWQARLPLV